MFKPIVGIIAVALAAPALAADQPEAVDDPNKIICKSVSNTGWRLQSGRVCKTAKAWSDRSRELRREKDEHGSYIGRYRCLKCSG